MSKDTPKDDLRQRTDWANTRQTEEPWKGVPEKDQFNQKQKPDLEKWNETKTH